MCLDSSVQRIVTAELDLELAGSVDLIFSLAVAPQAPVGSEVLTFAQGDRRYTPIEILDPSGARLHRIQAGAGQRTVRYRAELEGYGTAPSTTALEPITYLRPSRYCQSDEVFGQARRQFTGLSGHDLVAAVTRFVEQSVTYSPGLSLGTDSAVTTLMTGQGVCRDYAHVVIALLRAMDIPARYAACYAPGLRPMDFHAVAEAYLDGEWYVIDATRLANRHSLVRIATGRDAADCAFLSFHGANVSMPHLLVNAVMGDDAEAEVVTDDFTSLVSIA